MWSRREQHHAYRFLTRRIGSAMLSGEPETNELPMRRFGLALFGSVGLAALVVAGFTIFGLIFPGGGRPAENVIILERETGAIFVYQSQRLHPVLNWASARLILGQSEVKTMSRTSLRDVPRGPAVGIPDAPDTLPDAGSLVGLPWSVCSAPRSPESVKLATHVLPGQVPEGGQPPAGDEGLLVTTASGEGFLLWRDHRLRVAGGVVVTALGWAGVRPLPVAPAFLDAIPPGPDLEVLTVPGAGNPTPYTVDNQTTEVGQLFRDAASGVHYVMTAGGLVKVGALTARLWVAAGAAATPVSSVQAAQLLAGDGTIEPPGLPDTIPAARDAATTAAVCAAYRGETDLDRPVSVEAYDRVPSGLSAGDAPRPGGPVADRVALPGGRGALAATLMAPGSTAPGTVYLVTDAGVKYPLGGEDVTAVQASLGYDGVTPVTVPGLFLDLIPTGPALDPDAARAFATLSPRRKADPGASP